MVSRNTADKELVKKPLFFLLEFLFLFIILSWFFNLTFVNNLFIELFLLIIKGFISLFGSGTCYIVGNQIIVNGSPLVMIKECTGTPMYTLFAAFALAYQCPKNKKLKTLGFGLLMLFTLNIIRMFTIIIAAYLNRPILNFLHDFLWPSTFFIFTLIAAVYYIKRCSK